jgi:hypothetical protein
MKRPAGKLTSITRKSRLLCADCGELKRVKEVKPEPNGQTRINLECKHERGEILPSQPGAITIETLAVTKRKGHNGK